MKPLNLPARKPGTDIPPVFLRRTEAARLLSVSVQTLDLWIARGLIPVVRPSGGAVLIRPSDLENLQGGGE